ncbi:unnamed protein product [Mytilus edulis]|uniref:Novel STAND NTPase 3 domain-containing protein n=1 Tax=Mytilus edulis TaxID=6550 RepID=A0A8S3TUV1_MYTED|nr:unnamed protein product [Mytilus edulis]
MIILLRHIAEIEVSDKLPVKLDCRGAYLGTIKYYRNLLGHSITNTLTRETYASAWSHLTEAIRKLTTSNSFDEEIRRAEEIRIVEEIRRVEEMDIDLVNSDTESEIKSSFLEIKRLRAAYIMLEEDLIKMKRILSDPVPLNIRSQFTTQLRSWQEDDQMYVKTSWSEKILNLVQQSKLAAIIGGPGCGKTALLHNVAFQMAAIGYDVIPITFPYDIIEFYDAKRNTLFVIDNFCGKYSLDLQIHDSWIQVVKHIADIPLMDNFKIVLACRLQVFWDIRFNFKSMFENCSLNLHENTLTWAEKIDIAQKYNLTIEDKDNHTTINLLSCFCFPLLCTLNKHHPENDTDDMFMYPYHVLENELEIMFLNCEDGKFCAIVLLNAVPELINTRFMFVNPRADMDSFEVPIDDVSCHLDTMSTWNKLVNIPFFTYLNQLNSKQLFNLVNKEDVVDKSTPIISYVRSFQNMFPHIGWLVSIGADINHCNKYNMTALYYACSLDQFDVVEELLNKHADLNKCDKDGWSPLHIACANGFENIVVRILLDFNANINLRNNVGNSPLHIACNNKHKTIVEILLERNADRNLTNNEGVSPIELAQRSEDNILLLLLQNNENLLKPRMQGFSKEVDEQIRNDVDVNNFDTFGRSHLFLASKRGNTDIVKSLLKKNAEVNTCNKNGVSPLMIASSSGFLTIVQDLLENGAECDQTDNAGQSPLVFAVKNGHQDIMFELLINKANVNIRDEEGIRH